jgi:hypothetical protein
MRDRCHLDRPLRKVNSVVGKPIDDRTEGAPKLLRRDMLKTQVSAAGGTAASGFDLFEDGIGGAVAREDIPAIVAAAPARRAMA